MSYTILEWKCCGDRCRERSKLTGNRSQAVKEFYGYCEQCWLDLTYEQRMILLNTPEPIKPQKTHFWSGLFGFCYKTVVLGILVLLLAKNYDLVSLFHKIAAK